MGVDATVEKSVRPGSFITCIIKIVSFYHSYSYYVTSLSISKVKLISIIIKYEGILSNYGASVSNIPYNRMLAVQSTKHWLDKLDVTS